jgi:hypothetical protein
VLSGLQIIMAKKYSSIGNPALRDRIEEVYKIVPSGYTLHLVTSGAGFSPDADVKLRNFIESLKAPTKEIYEHSSMKGSVSVFFNKTYGGP